MTDHHRKDHKVGQLVVWGLGLSLVLPLAVWCAPLILAHLTGRHEVASNVSLGSVRKINFVGGFVMSTQVETEQTVILLRGAQSIAIGTLLQLHKKRWNDDEVCDVQGKRCWELISQ
jgi:hypothetical protein